MRPSSRRARSHPPPSRGSPDVPSSGHLDPDHPAPGQRRDRRDEHGSTDHDLERRSTRKPCRPLPIPDVQPIDEPGHGQRAWGVHPPCRTITIGQLLVAVGHGCRLDIISILSHGPLCSGEIARRLGLKHPEVSKELAGLLTFGIVEFEQVSLKRVYRLAKPVRTRRRKSMLQFGVEVLAGHWFWINLDESYGQEPSVPLPNRFIG